MLKEVLGPKARSMLVALLLLAACIGFGLRLNHFEKIRDWLVWRHLGLFLIALFWGICCTAGGTRLYAYLAGRRGLAEQLPFGFALGVLMFGLGIFGFGIVGGLGSGAFVALPLLLLLAGGLEPWCMLRRTVSRMWRLPSPVTGAQRVIAPVLVGVGVLSLAVIYIPTLTPSHLSYDTLWYHLPIAEHYASAGAIERFDEGWYMGIYPQLASWLYTWALLTPGMHIVNRALLCMQMEFIVFLGTLWTIVPLVRELGALTASTSAAAPDGSRTGSGLRGLSWVAMFAFPSVFLYDLVAAADHISALFACPAYALLLRSLQRLRVHDSALLALFVCGALLTKYSAGILFFSVILTFLFHRAMQLIRPAWTDVSRGAVVRCTLAFCAVGLVITSPHWLKNWLWYGSPVYPVLAGALPVTPWHQDATEVYRGWTQAALVAPPRTLWGFVQSWIATLRFSFAAHEFSWLSHGRPMVGSLFTLLTVPLLFLSRRKMLWPFLGTLHVGLFLWFFTHVQDRFLQSVTPVFAAVVALAAGRLWLQGRLLRILLVVLIALQVSWGADVVAWPYRHQWYTDVLERGASSLNGQKNKALSYFAPWPQIAKALPADAKVLLHEHRQHLGIEARVIHDWAPGQAALNYGRADGSAEVFQQLQELGATHLIWETGAAEGVDSIAGDIRFHTFVEDYAAEVKPFGQFRLGTMPASQPPQDGTPQRLLYWGCNRFYRDGLYSISAFAVHPQVRGQKPPTPLRPTAVWPSQLGSDEWDVPYVIVQEACRKETAGKLSSQYRRFIKRGNIQVWRRRSERTN